MKADENVLEKLLVMPGTNSFTVISKFGPTFLLILPALITANQFANTLVELFLLLTVNDSAHFVSFIIIQQDLPKVESVF